MLPVEQNRFKYLRFYFVIAFFVYITLAFYYSMMGYKEDIPTYMVQCRIFLSFSYIFMIMMSFTTVKARNLFLFNAVMFLLLVLYMKMTYYTEGVKEYGAAKDSYRYLSQTVQYGHLPLKKFLIQLRHLDYTRSDYGYFFLTYLVYNIYPDKMFVVYGMIFVNTLCVFASSFGLYRLQKFFSPSETSAKLVAILWTASPFLVMTVANGLKEVVFVTIIIHAFRSLYVFGHKRNMLHGIIAFFWIYLCLYFRAAVFYIFLLSALTIIFVDNKNKKLFLYLIVLAALLSGTLVPIIIEKVFGTSFENIMNTTDYRLNHADTSNKLYTMVLPLLSAIVGPFPNFDRQGSYSFMHSLAIYMKTVCGFFYIHGVFKIFYGMLKEYYPLLVYILCSILMTVTAGVSLDIRFHATFLPFVFLIIINLFERKPKWDFMYLSAVVIMIYIYSTRKVAYL
ncbi:MAG: hypothetical protein IKH19_08360 [Muribaculaceae bacterium]|nr:hypothetical protein [Muribaculaceae bacterium]